MRQKIRRWKQERNIGGGERNGFATDGVIQEQAVKKEKRKNLHRPQKIPFSVPTLFLFFCRKLLSATVRRGKTGFFYWIGSDSWGAKIHPVRHQEWAAEGAITILPKRSSLEGEKRTMCNIWRCSQAKLTRASRHHDCV